MDSGKNRESVLGCLKRYAVRLQPQSLTGKAPGKDFETLFQAFKEALEAQQAVVNCASGRDEARAQVGDALSEIHADSAVLSDDPITRAIGLTEFLTERNIKILPMADRVSLAESGFTASAGITGADFAVADTGTVVMRHGRGNPRLISIAPPVHIAIVNGSALLPDINALVAELDVTQGNIPSLISFSTGPSATADICMTPVRGMHGPGKMYVIVIRP